MQKRLQEKIKRANAIDSGVDSEGVPTPFVCSSGTSMLLESGTKLPFSITH